MFTPLCEKGVVRRLLKYGNRKSSLDEGVSSPRLPESKSCSCLAAGAREQSIMAAVLLPDQVVTHPHGLGPFSLRAPANFGWERARYYRRWSSDPELWREIAGPTLEPLVEQGPDAKRFLAILKHVIQERRLVALFRRHYAQVKDAVRPPFVE